MRIKKFAMSLMIILAGTASYAQSLQSKDDIYKNIAPAQVVDILVQKNYSDIKNLHISIMNYGGGKSQFDKLLDDFSLGFAYFLQGKIPEAAEVLKKNQRDIYAVASDFAKRYQSDSSKLQNEAIRILMKQKMDNAVNSRNIDRGMKLRTTEDMFMQNAAHAHAVGEENMTGGNPIDAIFYFRKAKQYTFQFYEINNLKISSDYARDYSDTNNKIYSENK